MSDLILLWMLILIPISDYPPLDTIEQLCKIDINRKVTVDRIVIVDDDEQRSFIALKIQCYKIKGKKI